MIKKKIAVEREGLATNFYVASLIPLIDGAPAIPIVVDCDANDSDIPKVHAVLFRVISAAASMMLKCKIVSVVFHG